MNAIEIKNLHFSYGKENVLDGVSLCLKEGRLAILAGENGAGKSTLLRLLLGELPMGESHKEDQEEGSSDGSIEILGQDIRQFKDWSNISYVPQNGMGGWKDFPASVEEIVRANLYKQIGLFRFAGKKERQQVRAALTQVGMEEYQNRLIGRLSGGQQQRVALARSMAVNPKVLLLDEPLSNLDAKLRIRMRDELKELQKKTGITMIFVTHDQEEAMALADKIAIMEGGRLIQMGAPREVYQNPASLFVMEFLGTADRAAMPDGSLIYFRPEDIRILGKAEETKARKDKGTERQAQNPDGRHLLTGTIVKSDYMGFYTQYFVKTEGGELLVREFEREYQNGDLVALELCGGKTF